MYEIADIFDAQWQERESYESIGITELLSWNNQ